VSVAATRILRPVNVHKSTSVRIRVFQILLCCILMAILFRKCLKSVVTSKGVLVTINVHEKPEFLREQVRNIQEHLMCRWVLILNTNESMKADLKGTELEAWCHPKPINKRRFHGSLLQGICANIKHSLDVSHDFDYVLVLSSRTFFRKHVTCYDLEVALDRSTCSVATNFNEWHWPAFKETSVGKRFFPHLVGGAHEGLFFPKAACRSLCELEPEIFDTNACVEEFVIQTICFNNGIKFAQLSWSEASPISGDLPLHKVTR